MKLFRKHKCIFCEEKVDHEKAAIIQFTVSDSTELQERYVCDECVTLVIEQSIDDEQFNKRAIKETNTI